MRSLLFLLLICFAGQLAKAQYTKLFDFKIETGIYPYHADLCYVDGYLYGTTSNGGTNGGGTIFKIKTDGTDFVKLIDMEQTTTGYGPMSGVIYDGTYLYGTTNSGGIPNLGVIFKLKPDGSEFTKIHEFTGDEGGNTLKGKLYFDGTYLYGLSAYGGSNLAGMIYKIKNDGTEFTTLFSFELVDTGNSPNGALISDGMYLYGMTVGGGSDNLGTVFKIKPDGTDFVKLMDMVDDPNGARGYGSLTYDGTYLYGMTNSGGEDNRGTIFKILTDGTGYQKLLDFNDDNGAQPLGSLIVDGTTLYGLAELGGDDYGGLAFSIQTDGTDYQTLIDFNGTENGSLPFGSLIMVNEALFGMTNNGGLNNGGVIFRYGEEEITLAVNDNLPSQMAIFPNPNTGQFQVTFPDHEKRYNVMVYTALGQKIWEEKDLLNSCNINLSTMTSGIYILYIENDQSSCAASFSVE